MKTLLVFTIFVASAVAQVLDQSVTVTTNYDYPEEKVKIFYIRRALVLKCELSIQGEYEIQWVKNGLPVNEVDTLKGRYTTSNTAGGEFRIAESIESDAGAYECIFSVVNARASFEAIANVQVSLPSDTNVIEGENLRLTCNYAGTNPTISWLVGNQSYTESRDRIVLEADESGVANVRLLLDAVTMEDRNRYTCVGRNKASQLMGENAEAGTLLRVRSKYAALWPFLGICVEVTVLCIAIWIYEKRRLNKLEDEDEDSGAYNSNKNGSSTVRQRHQ